MLLGILYMLYLRVRLLLQINILLLHQKLISTVSRQLFPFSNLLRKVSADLTDRLLGPCVEIELPFDLLYLLFNLFLVTTKLFAVTLDHKQIFPLREDCLESKEA